MLELGPGFTAVTGETGAGKTMVVTALGLLMGGRADPGAVRTGSPRALVEGVVDARALDAVPGLVEEAGGELEDGRLLLARQVSAEGRSRAFAGGAGVPAALLGQLAESLVAVHGQSDQHRLLRAEAQRSALDRFAGPEVVALRDRFAAGHAALRAAESELNEVVATARERAREADLLRFGLEEIEQVDPQPGEDTDLAAEESRLGFADSLRLAAEQARAALSSDDSDDPDALGAVATARRQLDDVREHDPEAAGAGGPAGRAQLRPVRPRRRRGVVRQRSRDRPGAAGDRLGPARRPARPHPQVRRHRRRGAVLGPDLGRAPGRPRRHRRTDRAAAGTLRGDPRRAGSIGVDLSSRRVAAAARLGEVVTDELTALAMPHAVLVVAVTQHEVAVGATDGLEVTVTGAGTRQVRMSSHGIDDVELRLAANVGSEPRALGKGASGGELSRVMLGLEVALAGTDPVPTFVFDEVDAGVGGKAAVEVGRRLALLARSAQVDRRHAPAPGRGLRRPARRGDQERRGERDPVRPDLARRGGPGARALPDAGRPRGFRDRTGACPGAARHRPRRGLRSTIPPGPVSR